MKKKTNDRQNFVIGIISLIVIFLLILSVFISKFNRVEDIKIDNNKDTWKYYDVTIGNIKSIMDEITVDADHLYWWDLDVKIKDDDFKSAIAVLVADVRSTYIMLSDTDEYYNSGILLKYRDREVISEEELELLNKTYDVDNVMLVSDFSGILISDDEEKSEEFLRVVNDFRDLKNLPLFTKEDATYEELVLRHIMITDGLEEITYYLQDIYLEYK